MKKSYRNICRVLAWTGLPAVLGVDLALAAEQVASANFGGPDSVPNVVEIDRTQPLDNWDDWKTSLSTDHGIDLGVDYSFVYFNADTTVPGGEGDAGAGMLRFFGSWTLT